jgi:hypothetical protein
VKKRWFFLAGLLFIVSFGIIICVAKSTPVTNTPEKTIEIFYSNFEEINPEKLANLFVEEERAQLRAHFEILSQHFCFEIKNLEIEVLSQAENTATVQAKYESVVTQKDKSETKSFRIVEQFELIKQNSQWLIARKTSLSCEEILD